MSHRILVLTVVAAGLVAVTACAPAPMPTNASGRPISANSLARQQVSAGLASTVRQPSSLPRT